MACSVRRNVDSQGTTPVTPGASLVAWSASAARSAIAVNDRAPGQHRAQGQAQDRCEPVPHIPPLARIRHRGQHRQQPPVLLVQALGGSDQLANRRVNRG
jgi:hypothetical protein